MANLETIELTISGSAEQAQQGINQLITSLGSLSDAITKPYSDLRDLCAVLKDIAGYCKSIKLPSIGKVTGATQAVAKAKKAVSEYDIEHNNGRGYVVPQQSAESIAKDQEWFSKFRANASADYERLKTYHEWATQRRAELEKVAEIGKGFKEDNRPLAQNSVYIKDMAENMYHYGKAASEANGKTSILSSAIQSFKNGIGTVKEGVKNLTSGFTGLFSKIKRIATTMLIRSAIRGLIKSLKEGVNNVYQWSKLNNGEFAKSFDTLKNKAGELKNSIGAAISPVIQAAIPLLNQLASAAIDAFNWVNQLISLLTGKSSWTKATEGVHDYTDATKKASGANKEWLASFDELNVMSSGGGGSGSSSNQVDYSDMFEEVTEFEEHIRELADFFKENAENIKKVAIEAGAAFLGWKVSSAFGGVLGTIATIAAAGLVMDITWRMTAMFDEKYIDTGKEGWLVADALTNAVGATLAGKLIASVLGTGWGMVTAGFTLLVSGAISYGIALANKDSDNAKALKTIGLAKAAIGDLLIAAGFYVTTGSAGAGIFAALFAAPLFYATAVFVADIVSAKNEQKIANEAFKNAGKGGISVEKIYEELNKEFQKVSEPYKLSIEAFADNQSAAEQIEAAFGTIDRLNQLITSDQMLTQSQANDFKEAWATVFSAFETKSESEWNTIFEGFNAALTAENEELRKQAKEARITALQMKHGIDEIEAELIDRMNELTEKIAKGSASAEEMEEYVNKVSIFAEETTNTLTSFKDKLKEATTIDFSGTDGINAAKQFITDVTEQYRESVKAIDEGLASQLSAIDEQKTKIQKYIDKGLIDPETGREWIKNLEDFAQQFKDAAETNKKQLADDMKDSFVMVLNTAREQMKSYLAEDGTFDFGGNQGAESFMQYTIRPLVQAIKDSDVDINEALSEVFDFADALQDYVNYEDWQRECDFVFGEIGKIAAERAQSIDLDNIVIKNAFDLVSWDDSLASNQEIAKKLTDAFGIETAIRSMKDKWKVDVNDMVKFYGYDEISKIGSANFVKAMINVYGKDGIAAIKTKLPRVKASQILEVTNWKEFSSDQRLEFLTALKNSYGSSEAIRAAHEMGIDIGALVKSGMNSQNPEIKKQAEEWNKLIKNGVENPSPKPKVEVQEDRKQTEETKTSITKFLGIFKPSVQPEQDKPKTDETKKNITSVVGTVTSKVVTQEDRQKTTETKKSIVDFLGIFKPNVEPQENRTKTTNTKNTIIDFLGIFKPDVNPKENRTETDKTKSGISATIGTFNPWVNATENTKSTSNTKTSIFSTLGNVTTQVNVGVNDKTMQEARKGIVSSLGSPFSVKVNANLNNGAAFKSSVAGALNGIKLTISGGSGDSKQFAKVTAVAASGGLFNSGDVFIANENGTGEMIGRFGNQTGVANQREIVAGIQKGVADANAEQNALLRQQNNLLRALLEKDSTVHIGASSEMGRVVSRSLGMYNALVGG